MRKIDRKYENPIDNIFIDIGEICNPLWKRLNFTPNTLTTLSLLFGLLAVYNLYKRNILLFMIFYIISYFFDCNDGNYAREYNLTTEFGDLYDHIKDVVIFSLLLLIIIYRYHKNTNFIPILLVIIIFSCLMCCHLGCQEQLYNKNDSVLRIFRFFEKPDNIVYFRWFGCGTFIMVFLLAVFLLDVN
jgi:phosphatidylglycerophosphate synthase